MKTGRCLNDIFISNSHGQSSILSYNQMILSFMLKHTLFVDVEHFSQRTEADFK